MSSLLQISKQARLRDMEYLNTSSPKPKTLPPILFSDEEYIKTESQSQGAEGCPVQYLQTLQWLLLYFQLPFPDCSPVPAHPAVHVLLAMTKVSTMVVPIVCMAHILVVAAAEIQRRKRGSRVTLVDTGPYVPRESRKMDRVASAIVSICGRGFALATGVFEVIEKKARPSQGSVVVEVMTIGMDETCGQGFGTMS